MAIYKAEVIAQGTAKEVRATLKKVWNLKDKKLESQLDILEQTVKLEDNRIGYVDGLFDAIDPNYYPKGFSFEDSIFVDKYGRGVETNISYTGGESGYFIRYYDDTSKIFTFSHGFLESLPRWVDDVHVPLVSGKGIPTQAYFTLRQMKILEIPNAGIELVRMTQIQNLETMGYIAKIMKNNNLTDITKVNILEAPSMNYVKTTMQQAGYELKQGKIISNKSTEAYTGSELRSAGFKINEEFLNRHNLKMNDKLFINFDIKIQVKPIK